MNARSTSSRDHQPGGDHPVYRFRLFVAGDEPNSRHARATLERLCATHLRDRHELIVVHVFGDYQAAIEHRIIVVPTLLIESPPPVRTVIGSLDDEAQLLAALGLSGTDTRP
jgi:circadian clock protein KaiB